ncbi:hypothetical protein R69749_07930 [Paraburkholderia domus]|nr:hypothetical protein R70006_05617 [Paraburkholderia domus]CAE6896975.1 hypothetical protein R69749_07930 [Paraburkholderia domus]
MTFVEAFSLCGIVNLLTTIVAHTRYFALPPPDLPSFGFPAPRVMGCIF